ncbi:MAG: hypothetical protein ACLT2D_01600 [Oscillospiraceae bacterium]
MKNVTPSVSWRNFGIVMFLLGIAGTACGIFIHNIQFVLIYVFISLAISLACWTVWFSVFISFGQQEWTLRRWFFSTKRYTLNDIKSITFGTPAGGFTLHLRCGQVHVGARAKNGAEFRTWVEKEYLRVNKKPLPYEPPHIFHNNIKNPWFFLVASIGVGLLALVMAICTTVALSSAREVPTLTECSIAIKSVSDEFDYAQLSSNLGDFTVPLCVQPETLSAYCGSEIIVQVEESQNPDDSRWIWGAAVPDGKVLFTPQDVCAYLTHLDIRNRLVMWGIVLTYWLLFAGACYILNHAPTFPLLAALLVKPDQRNF